MPLTGCRGAERMCAMMDMVESITNDTQHELDSTLGVLFIGFMLSIVLYGLSTFQMHVYFTRYPKDGRRTKALVLLIWFIDTASSTLISRMEYYYLIDRFSASFQDLEITNVFLAENALAGFAVLIVHLFYSFRVWTISGKDVMLSGATLTTAVASFVFTIIATVKLTSQQFMANLLTPEIEVVLGLTSGLSIVSNLFIVTSHAFYLRPSREPHIKYPSSFLPQAVLVLASRGVAFTLLHIALLVTIILASLARLATSFASLGTPPFYHKQRQVLRPSLSSTSDVTAYNSSMVVYINSFFAVLNTRTPVNGCGINEEEDANAAEGQGQLSALVFQDPHERSFGQASIL
ncbi:hypothetical protein BDY19DRAFT_995778 [Irpex rosettiformis]|uniref:Uncharacterized protein n=1 Tax=Irpex rosettiformis TaxID=378272 RepID=A0ACB8TWU5_9APHY|nr:hypothetical protein BDY19DRAFT_995778 [Irpex rosettiformis]